MISHFFFEMEKSTFNNFLTSRVLVEDARYALNEPSNCEDRMDLDYEFVLGTTRTMSGTTSYLSGMKVRGHDPPHALPGGVT